MSLWCSGRGLLARADIPSTPGVLFLCTVFFFSVWYLFFNTTFSFGLSSVTLTADPAGHGLGSIYILSLSPEFYFGKGISRALDLHAGISCLNISLL